MPENIEFPIWKIKEQQRALIYSGILKTEVVVDIHYNFDDYTLIGEIFLERKQAFMIFESPNPKIKIDGFTLSKFHTRRLQPYQSESRLACIEILIDHLKTSKDCHVDKIIFPVINSKRFRGDIKISNGSYSYTNGRAYGSVGEFDLCIDNTLEESNTPRGVKPVDYEITSLIEAKSNRKDLLITQYLGLVEKIGWAYSFAAGSPAHIGIVWGIKDSSVKYFEIKSVAIDKKQDMLNWATWLKASSIIRVVSDIDRIKNKTRFGMMKILMSFYYNMKSNDVLSKSIIDLAVICEIVSKSDFRGKNLSLTLQQISSKYKIETSVPKTYSELSKYITFMRLNRLHISRDKYSWLDVPSTFVGTRNMMIHGEFAGVFIGPPNANKAIHQLDMLAAYYAQLIILNYISYSGQIYDLMSNIENGTNGFKEIN